MLSDTFRKNIVKQGIKIEIKKEAVQKGGLFFYAAISE
jgi:hypothetical protein